ncbi:ATP-binding protein [Beijerinckia sp. GAS462]|uniref:ATP-binding protein n=1 Tax=Beijerinckia sp. GAS462 TaxID=3039852 RepID=UPI00147D49B1|nr:ATP-binding protein [Beijerinckia sp. GAS462]
MAEPPLAGLQAGGAAYFIVAGSRIVHASDAALALFRAADLIALENRLFNGNEPGARRLTDLARSLAPGTPMRLERLRFFFGRATHTVTFACRRLTGTTPFFVAGALDAPSAFLTAAPTKVVEEKAAEEKLVEAIASPPPAEAVAIEDAPSENTQVEQRIQVEQQIEDEQQIEATADTPVAEAESEPAAAVVEAAPPAAAIAPVAAVPTRPRDTGTVRFLWQTDGERRFVKLTGALCETMGCQTADLIGQDFIAVTERFGVDRIEDLRTAFARHETWSGLRVLWPINGTHEAAPVTLGGLPTFDEDHVFSGFSGFGVINLDKIVARPALVVPAATVPADTDVANEVENKTIANNDDQAISTSAISDDEHDALDTAREKMFAPLTPEPDYLNYAPNVVPLRDWQRDRQSTANGAANAVVETPLETPPAEIAPVETPVTPETTATTLEASPTPSSVSLPVQVAPEPDNDNLIELSTSERQAFREIARSIVADIERGEKPTHITLPPVAAETADAAHDSAANDHAQESDNHEPAPITPVIATTTASEAVAQDKREQDKHEQDKARQDKPEQDNAVPAITAPVRGDAVSAPAQASAEQMRAIAAALGVAGPIAVPATEAVAPAEAAKPVEVLPVKDLPTEIVPAEIMPANAAAILDRLNVGILVMLGGVPTFINRHLLDTLGFADIDAFHDWGGPERMIHGQALDAHGADGTLLQVETESGALVKLNGHMQTTEWNGQPATLMTFRPVEAPQVVSKPADSKTTDLAKPESEARAQDAEIRELHAILDTATDGVAILDGAGTILSLNRSAEALFGYERGEVAGQSLTTLFAKDSQRAALDYLEGLKSHGVRSVLNDGREVIGRARMGGQIPIFMTIGRIGSETAEKFCAVMRDMSDWKNAERELKDARREAEQASALKSDFLAKISHEIRTPLNAILGFAEVIIDERFGPVANDRYKEYLRDIHASGTHVMSLVNDLLDLSKIEAGKLDLNFGAVDANKIVNECVSIMQPLSVRERVIMRLALAPQLPNIVADERSLRQIVLNILSNAVKFNQAGGQVIVSTALTDSGQAVVRVRDTGIGMSEKDLEIALEPFRQIQTSRQTSGTGLGLPLTKALVEANRAAFSIKSKPGEGTLVEVTFPSTRVLAE